MRSNLLQEKDYERMMKMTVSEITKTLQNLHYKEDIDALGGAYTTTELIEKALSRNRDRSFQKLRRICQGDDDLIELVDAYLERYDLFNIKTVLRAIKTGQKDEATDLLSNAGINDKEFYQETLRLNSIEEAIQKLSTTKFVNLSMRDKSLQEIENLLEKSYYQELLDMANNIPKQVNLFKEFILNEIDVVNILTLLRLKKENVSNEKIRELLIIPERDVGRYFLEKVINNDSVENILEQLKDSDYGEMIEKAMERYEETQSLMPIEKELKRALLEKSVLMLHKDILSPSVILGYMFAKDVEIRNLRIIIKGKKFDLDEEFIKKELVF